MKTFQAYEGLKTADRLKENYLFIPEKVKEVYLAHLLGQLDGFKVRAWMHWIHLTTGFWGFDRVAACKPEAVHHDSANRGQ